MSSSRMEARGVLENSKLAQGANIVAHTFWKRRVDRKAAATYSSGVNQHTAMNSKFLKAFAAIALLAVASSPLALAAAVTPSQFTTTLKAKVGNKVGLAAANAAAKYLGATLKDKLNKKN